MTGKIIRFVAVSMFSSVFLLLLGSMPISSQQTNNESCELQTINKTANNAIPTDLSQILEKNPLILLEFSVE